MKLAWWSKRIKTIQFLYKCYTALRVKKDCNQQRQRLCYMTKEVDSAERVDFAFKENDKFDPIRKSVYPSMPKINIAKMRKELLLELIEAKKANDEGQVAFVRQVIKELDEASPRKKSKHRQSTMKEKHDE